LDRGEVDRVRAELAGYRRFAELSGRIVEVNEAICEARAAGAGVPAPSAGGDGGKGGCASRSRRSSRPR